MPPPSPCVNVDVTLHRCQTTLAEKQYLMSWNKNWLFGGCDWLMPSRQTSDPWPAVVNKKQKKLLWSGFFFTLPCFMSLPIEHWLQWNRRWVTGTMIFLSFKLWFERNTMSRCTLFVCPQWKIAVTFQRVAYAAALTVPGLTDLSDTSRSPLCPFFMQWVNIHCLL